MMGLYSGRCKPAEPVDTMAQPRQLEHMGGSLSAVVESSLNSRLIWPPALIVRGCMKRFIWISQFRTGPPALSR